MRCRIGPDCLECQRLHSEIDISPLSKFIGKGLKQARLVHGEHWADAVVLDGTVLLLGASPRFPGGIFQDHGDRLGWYDHNGVPLVFAMYGYDFTPPIPEPEKSPQEKALDDFIAKRKAKREAADKERRFYGDAAIDADTARLDKGDADSKALGNAMSKLIPAEKDFRARLVNVKVPNE